MRGKPDNGGLEIARRGLIPACAGKTRVPAAPPPRGRAHPRVCGENSVHATCIVDFRGSSPRVRGKLVEHVPYATARRLIPACAGKTTTRTWVRESASAHPRVCGENLAFGRAYVLSIGSSPRVRGKRAVGVLDGDVDRLIPACAGKTRRPGGRRSGVSAHPRVCGENPWTAYGAASPRGSSPRVRGKPCSSCQSLRQSRLIPACAGKTASCVAIE